MNYPLIKVEDNELQQFESNTFASSFTQEVSTYAKNCFDKNIIFYSFFVMNEINENVGLTNEIIPNSMIIDIFKEMTNCLEVHCTVDGINKTRAYLNNKIFEAKKE